MAAPRPASILLLLEEALAGHGARLGALSDRARSGGDDDLVHDVRVALRRIEALARLFRGVPGEGDGEAARAAARDLRRRLSLLRSEEVGRALLAARADAAGAGVEALVFPGGLPAVRVDVSEIGPVEGELAEWRRRLVSASNGAFAPRAGIEALLVRRTLRRLGNRGAELSKLLPPGRRTLHPARIAAKKLRYALEAVEPLDPGTRPLLRLLRSFQDAAGDAHDLGELAARVRAAAGSRPDFEPLLRGLEADAATAFGAARRRGEALAAPVRRLSPALGRRGTR
ncbi:MAG: CHAD domain-containing protein [Thermoanaerobaculia bacterium]